MQPAVEILFEDNHLLVVNKPAGLATMGSGDGPSVHRWGCDYIRARYHKPGRVYLGIVHRLDAMTSGALVLARTSKAASRLSEQFRQSHAGPEKIYLVVVSGHVTPPAGTLRDRIVKDEAAHRMRLVGRTPRGNRASAGTTQPTAAALEAILDYRVLRQSDGAADQGDSGTAYSLLAVRLQTGRKHQIRVQFADRGHVVWGDTKYGDRHHRRVGRGMAGITLHAASLTIAHPVGGRQLLFRCPPPTSWGRFRPTPQEWEAALATWDSDWESPSQKPRPLS